MDNNKGSLDGNYEFHTGANSGSNLKGDLFITKVGTSVCNIMCCSLIYIYNDFQVKMSLLFDDVEF